MSKVGEHLKHKTYVERDETVLEHAVDAHWTEGQSLLSHLPKKEGQALSFVPELAGAVFVGHIMTDLDSVAGAIGAAHLYGGDPAIASEINTETEFALKEWGCALPATIETTLEADPRRNVCLVDFQQQSQLNPVIPMSNIVGIIDHHALQSNTIVTEKPIFVDIRPWGCMSSIIAHNFATQEKFLPKPIAGMLLSAILSDTLNLRSPTTTAWDERIVAMLVQYTKVKDVNELAARQFRAKSHSLSLMTPYALVNGDVKRFKFAGENGNTYTVAYSVVETTDAPASLARAAELAPEMRAVKAADASVDAVLLAVVDIVALTSTLVVCGRVEASLATAAYGGRRRGRGGRRRADARAARPGVAQEGLRTGADQGGQRRLGAPRGGGAGARRGAGEDERGRRGEAEIESGRDEAIAIDEGRRPGRRRRGLLGRALGETRAPRELRRKGSTHERMA